MDKSDFFAFAGGIGLILFGILAVENFLFFIPFILSLIILFLAGLLGDKELLEKTRKLDINCLEIDILNKKAIELGFTPDYNYEKLIKMVVVDYSKDKELRELQEIRRDLMIKKFGKKRIEELLKLKEIN